MRMDKQYRNLIYSVEITPEVALEKLYKELMELRMLYCDIDRHLFALALPPSAYKALELALREKQRFPTASAISAELEAFGAAIVVSPMNFIVPIFKGSGWHLAHMEAKRLVALTGGEDLQ